MQMTEQKDYLYKIFEQLWQNINGIFDKNLKYGDMKIFAEYILENLYYRKDS